MSAPTGGAPLRVVLIADVGTEHDATKLAKRYVLLRLKAAQANQSWLDSGDDGHLQKRDNYLFRSAEIVTTIRDLLSPEAGRRFGREADRAFGPVRFWPE